MQRVILLLTISILLVSCLKDREFQLKPSESDQQVTAGVLLVNEICAAGSTYSSEFGGTPPDWVEIFNPSADTFILAKDKWFTTDQLSTPFKYGLPEIKIPPHKFFVFCCDGIDSVGIQVHTNFSLSSSGEEVGLYYKTDAGPYLEVDKHVYTSVVNGISVGRIPDGTENWNNCSLMTPGTPNQ